MSKKFMRIFAVVLSLAMVFGTVAIMPTVTAKTGELADDMIFHVDFEDYEKGDAIVDEVTGTTIVESCQLDAKIDFDGNTNGQSDYTLDGVLVNGDGVGIAWDSDTLDPMAQTKDGFTLNMWIRLNSFVKYSTFFTYARNETSTTRNAIIGQETNSNALCATATYGTKTASTTAATANNVISSGTGWYMVTFTQDADTKEWNVYLNGVNKKTATADYSAYEIWQNDQDVAETAYYTLGGLLPGSTSTAKFKGVVGPTTMYGRALTADEVSSVYNDTITANGKPADYTAVEAAIAAIPADLSGYSAESVAALNAAKDAVVYGKIKAEQAAVDGYAAAILDAISKLEPSSTGLDITIDISDGAVAAAEGENKFDITWNANVKLGDGLDLATINEKAKFTGYGVYYGTSKEAVAALADGGEEENARIKYFGEGDNIDVYTIFGFRLKNVASEKSRAAQFFITYEMDGKAYTVLSNCVSATAAIAE